MLALLSNPQNDRNLSHPFSLLHVNLMGTGAEVPCPYTTVALSSGWHVPLSLGKLHLVSRTGHQTLHLVSFHSTVYGTTLRPDFLQSLASCRSKETESWISIPLTSYITFSAVRFKFNFIKFFLNFSNNLYAQRGSQILTSRPRAKHSTNWTIQAPLNFIFKDSKVEHWLLICVCVVSLA